MNALRDQHCACLTRILVRSISGLVSQPKLIDEVWQDTIDLAEVHVRGSAITNEIRRSTTTPWASTRSAGARILAMAAHRRCGFPGPGTRGPAEQPMRPPHRAAEVSELVERIASDLEQLLGSSRSRTRCNEWRDIAYAERARALRIDKHLEEELESWLSMASGPQPVGVPASPAQFREQDCATAPGRRGQRAFDASLKLLQEALPMTRSSLPSG